MLEVEGNGHLFSAWTRCSREGYELSWEELGALHMVFARHSCKSMSNGTSELRFEQFISLATELGLPVVAQSIEQQRRVFALTAASSTGSDATVSFEEFCLWVSMSNDPDATAIKAQVRQEDATLWGSAARALTSVTRPLTGVFSHALIQVKLGFVIATKKFAITLKAAMHNPARLFKRKALSPLEVYQAHPQGLLAALRAELAAGGLRGIASNAAAPVLVNGFVAMAMFHTYSHTRTYLYRRTTQAEEGSLFSTSLGVELAAGGAAGVVQATLNTPLYNLKLRRLRRGSELRGVLPNLLAFQRQRGLPGLYRNLSYVLVQEGSSLAAFFSSYELLKEPAIQAVRQHVDPSGEKDMFACAFSAMGAGMVLALIGTPFENVLEWHVTRRTAETPRSVIQHFWRDAKPRSRMRIVLSGLRRKLPLAPLAGLPLLAYEAMLHSGFTPPLHDTGD